MTEQEILNPLNSFGNFYDNYLSKKKQELNLSLSRWTLFKLTETTFGDVSLYLYLRWAPSVEFNIRYHKISKTAVCSIPFKRRCTM